MSRSDDVDLNVAVWPLAAWLSHYFWSIDFPLLVKANTLGIKLRLYGRDKPNLDTPLKYRMSC